MLLLQKEKYWKKYWIPGTGTGNSANVNGTQP